MSGVFRLIKMKEPWNDVLKRLNLTVTTVRPVEVAVDVLKKICRICTTTTPAPDSTSDGSSRGGSVAGDQVH